MSTDYYLVNHHTKQAYDGASLLYKHPVLNGGYSMTDFRRFLSNVAINYIGGNKTAEEIQRWVDQVVSDVQSLGPIEFTERLEATHAMDLYGSYTSIGGVYGKQGAGWPIGISEAYAYGNQIKEKGDSPERESPL